MPARRPPRLLRSIQLAVAPPEDIGAETIGVMPLDSDRGEVQYLLTTDSALAIRTKMQEFLDISSGSFAGLQEPQEGQTQTVPVSPASVTVGEAVVERATGRRPSIEIGRWTRSQSVVERRSGGVRHSGCNATAGDPEQDQAIGRREWPARDPKLVYKRVR